MTTTPSQNTSALPIQDTSNHSALPKQNCPPNTIPPSESPTQETIPDNFTLLIQNHPPDPGKTRKIQPSRSIRRVIRLLEGNFATGGRICSNREGDNVPGGR